MKSNKWYWIGATIFLSLALGGCALAAGGGLPARPGAATAAVESAQVTLLKVDNIVEASGTSQAAQTATLFWKTSGIVDAVNVQAGDQVRAGQILAQIELSSAPASVLQAQIDLINAHQALDDLYDTALPIAQAEQKVAAAKDTVDSKQTDLDRMGTPARQADIESARATVTLAKIQLDKAWDKYKPYQNKPEDNPIRAGLYNAWAQAKQNYDSAVQRLNNLSGNSVNDLDRALAEADLNLAQANLAEAERTLADLQAGPDADEIAKAQARVQVAEASLAALQLEAPFNGELLSVTAQTGDLVSSGNVAMVLANRTPGQVEARVDEADLGRIRLNADATVVMDALPGQTLKGKVTFINPQGETISGTVYYRVTITLETGGPALPLGATADVTITAGEAQESLAVPVRAILSDDQGEYVLVLRGESQTRVAVTSYELYGDLVTVQGNLQPGDTVVINTVNGLDMQGMPFGGG